MRNTLRQFLVVLPTKLREEDKIKHMTGNLIGSVAASILASPFIFGLLG